MVEKNLDGVLFLREDITKDKIREAIERLKIQYPSIDMSLPLDEMVESFYDFRKWKKVRVRRNASYLKIGDIEFAFQNLETTRRFRYIYSGRRQVFFNVWMDPDVGAWAQFMEEPEKAIRFKDIFSMVASSLDGYLGFVGHELTFKDIDDTTDMEYAMRLIKRFSSFYLDRQLAESIGLEELREWAGILKEIDHVGYFVSYSDDLIFFPGLKEIDDVSSAEDQKVVTFYHERLMKEMLRRLHSEFVAIHDKQPGRITPSEGG